MEKTRTFPKGMFWPFLLLTLLFFAWAVPNNLTDTMLAAFKRVFSLSDSKTAWIQVVCYLLGYGLFALPGAYFIKRYTYKSGVILGLLLYAIGSFLFYPAMLLLSVNAEISFSMFLFAIFVLFAGLSVLETSTNSYVCAIGDPETATRRLNFTQSFNPFGAIAGVVISQIFILSKLNVLNAGERSLLAEEELRVIQGQELTMITTTYVVIGICMLMIMLAFILTKMPKMKEHDANVSLKKSFTRLLKNKNYVWGVIAQFFYVGAQIAVWSFTIRYAIQQLNLDQIISSLGKLAGPQDITAALISAEPLAACFYKACQVISLDQLLPRTAEQAAATYYIMSLILFVVFRFVSTFLMKFISPGKLLIAYSILAVLLSIVVIYNETNIGLYALVGISGFMSLMFPTIYSFGIKGLGDDTKIGGAGMIMSIAGAAVLTQIQGILSDQLGDIHFAYWVPAIAFMVVLYFALVVVNKNVKKV